jgi:hypothetical protein
VLTTIPWYASTSGLSVACAEAANVESKKNNTNIRFIGNCIFDEEAFL